MVTKIDKMEEGAITLLDILGWKGIWQREENPLEKLTRIINVSQHSLNIFKEKDEIGIFQKEKNIFKNLKTEILSISDTIALITYGDCNLSLEFHSGLSIQIIVQSLHENLGIRGATCYGKISKKNNIIVGPAVDEVASWYESANWIGVFHTPSALYRFKPELMKYKLNLKKYSVSTKNIGKFSTNCVNWVHAFRNRNSIQESFLKMGPITPEIEPKLSNTLDFFDEMDKQLDALIEIK
ncbi:MAG: hypothetical protein Q8L64_01850 [bacterium]|nr:hypothetical protein [bacterium]